MKKSERINSKEYIEALNKLARDKSAICPAFWIDTLREDLRNRYQEKGFLNNISGNLYGLVEFKLEAIPSWEKK